MADNTIDKALPNEPRKEITLPGEEQIQETLAPPPKLKRAYNKKVVPVAKDPDDELMTVKQYKALLLAQKEEPKPKRKYVKKIKPEPLEQQPPPPTPVNKQQPQMMWA